MDAVDCLAEHGRNRDYAGLCAHLGGRHGQGVGYDQFLDDAVLQNFGGFAREHGVGGVAVDVARAVAAYGVGGGYDGAAGADFVVHDDGCLVAHVADEGCGFYALLVADTHLFDDGKMRVEPVRHVAGALGVAGVRRHDDGVVLHLPVPEVVRQTGDCAEFVEGDVEEALYLSGVQLEGEHAVCACGLDEVCDEAGGDWHAGLVFLVAARVGEVGDDGGYPARGRALCGVDHNQQFHYAVVDREGDGLYEEDILLAYVFPYSDEGVVVAELEDLALAQWDAEVSTNVFCQLAVGVAAEHFQVFIQSHLIPRVYFGAIIRTMHLNMNSYLILTRFKYEIALNCVSPDYITMRADSDGRDGRRLWATAFLW